MDWRRPIDVDTLIDLEKNLVQLVLNFIKMKISFLIY